MVQQWTHQDELTSHTGSWKNEKICTTKDRIKDKHKKWYISETGQKQKFSTAMNCQQTHNALTTQKNVAVFFKDVKTEETFSSQDQKLLETTNLWQLFSDKKSPQRKFVSATIANPVELMNGTTRNTSRWLN